MEKLTSNKKTIRVSYCDPDATDSSSDEGSGESQKRYKRKVHEIEVEFVEKNQDTHTDSGDFQEETGFEEQNLTSDGEKILGVRTMKSSEFWAEKDPIKKRWVRLFATAEAAYLAKESKFAVENLRAQHRIESSLSPISPFHDWVVLDSNCPPTSAGEKIQGVVRTNSGKFGASVRDPFKRKKKWIGSFTTAEEASRSCFAKKAQLEFEKLRVKKLKSEAKMLRYNQREDGVASGKSTFEDSVVGNNTPVTSFRGGASTRIPGVRRRNSGKFCAEIRNPFTKRRVWIGTFATEEEASRAYLAKKAEFAAKKLIANLTLCQEGASTRIPGVQKRNSGKFSVEIRNPKTKRCVWNGTKQMASRAHLAKKAEFDELRAKQCFQRVAYEKSLAPGLISSVTGIETSDLSNETGVAESAGQNNVSGNQEVAFGFFKGVQVVDKNGFLVGEFSSLDDLSICSEEEDANS